MKKGHFAIKQGPLDGITTDMHFDRQTDGSLLLSILIKVPGDKIQLAKEQDEDTEIDKNFIPGGVFKLKGNKLTVFPTPEIRGDNGANTISISGDSFVIQTDGEKREHGAPAR